ncbi:MAG: M23 family metallopeptidase [Chloroflexi bacterium]|nr:M23 family metallopeptidase [Chloroflexota bacterium]
MASELGVPVYASAGGVVVYADNDWKDSGYSPRRRYYGNSIVIRHENDLYTLYGHLSRILVSAGQKVKVGDLIGEVGHTGVAIGSHLHFEVRRGGDGRDYFSTQNPELWLALEKDRNGAALGAMVIFLDIGMPHKVQRNLVVEYFPVDAETPLRFIPITTYPNGFEHNTEDAALSNLSPGRYRITFNDSAGVRHRWVYIESGKLTQVNFIVK